MFSVTQGRTLTLSEQTEVALTPLLDLRPTEAVSSIAKVVNIACYSTISALIQHTMYKAFPTRKKHASRCTVAHELGAWCWYGMSTHENGRQIVSNVGSSTIDGVASRTQHGYGSTSADDIWIDDTWLCCGSMRLLQLPFGSESGDCHIGGDQAAVGIIEGLVLVFGIDRIALDLAL